METKILIFLSLMVIAFAFSLLITYIKLFNERKEHKRAKMINEFFLSITAVNSGGPSLNLLIKMDIDLLGKIKPQLLEYYQKNFFKLVTKSAVQELDRYVSSINELPEVPQKTFIKETLKKELFAQPLTYLVDFVFRTIKVSNSTNRDCSLFEFLFDDIVYLEENRNYIITIINQCKNSFEKIQVEEELKASMMDDFDELLKIIE